MSNEPTPRTDANACYPSSNDDSDNYSKDGTYVDSDFARQLERELVEVTKQRDEAREELATVTAQRDRLAEALQMITSFDYTDMQCDNGYGFMSVANEALQSLTTKQ